MPKESTTIKKTLSSLTTASLPSRAPLRIHFSEAIMTTPGTHLPSPLPSPPTFSVSALALDNLTFPNCDLSPTTSAASHSSSSTSSILSSASSSLTPRYLIAGLDLDPPFPAFPILSPVLLSLQADLELCTDELSEGEEFIRLKHPEEGGGEVVKGVKSWGGGGGHRFMYVMWEQPRDVNGERVRDEFFKGMEHGKGEDGGVGWMERMRWDVEAFERRLGLGRVVAGNWFVC